jgi:N-acetylglucosamine kinase-like BadF-type ATPase
MNPHRAGIIRTRYIQAATFLESSTERTFFAEPVLAYSVSVRYILGFDGGGTKTECVLMNSEHQILARTYAGPSNPSRIGVEAAACAVAEAADFALREAKLERTSVTAIGAGLAGTAKPEMKQRMTLALQMSFPAAAITVLTDLEAALAAAGEGPAIVLVAGTGSAAIGRNAQGQVHRAGGYGPASSDEGSAYDIGREAIAAAVEARKKTGADSALGQQILTQLRYTEWPVVQHRAQTMPDEIFPPLFPVVAAAADSGDPTAREILNHAAAQLASLIDEVAAHLNLRQTNFLLAKIGGTIGRSVFFDAQLDATCRQLFPQAQIGALRISPAEAAALAAKY